LCQYRISFVTMALRDTLCNDSNDHSLIRSDRKGMRRERYPSAGIHVSQYKLCNSSLNG
jgi:hypothetical protein